MRTVVAILLAALAAFNVSYTPLGAQIVSMAVSLPATACTNQFIRSIAVNTGIGTCATVSLTADVTGALGASNGGTGVSNSFNTTVTSAVSIGRGQYQGVAGATPATAGNIGESADCSVALAAVSLTSNTAANICSVSVSAGEWEISGIAYFAPGATTTVNNLAASIGTTTAAFNTAVGQRADYGFNGLVLGNNDNFSAVIPNFRISVASPTTYFFVGISIFGVSTMSVGGVMHAVRIH